MTWMPTAQPQPPRLGRMTCRSRSLCLTGPLRFTRTAGKRVPRVSYRVEFRPRRCGGVHTLPSEGQDALIARAVDLAEQPWADVVIRRPGDDPAFRETTFGDNRGICAFHVDADTEVVRIFEIVWVG